MIHGGNTPQEFLDKLDEDWRKEKLIQIREIVLAYDGLEETMTYGMLGYGNSIEKEPLFALNAQKNYVAFYVGDIEKIDPGKQLLQGLSLGKGCIRFSKTKRIEDTGFKEFVRKAVEIWKSGGDTSC